MSRDDFSSASKAILAKRVGHLCSNPECSVSTAGPHTDPAKAVNTGVAAHISAASAGGPRFDGSLTNEQRSDLENALWLCQNCAKLVDSDLPRFTTQTLRHWKVLAEAKARRSLNTLTSLEYFPQAVSAVHTPIPKIASLTYDDARHSLLEAGWQPHRQHWSHAAEPDMQYGNGLHFWEKGFHEIINASGTGLGHCTFGFVDVYRNKLIVVTAGEVCEAENCTAYVWNWYLHRESDA
jgi:hypothetical protein